MPAPWVYDDGGRQAAGYKGHAGDCAVRAITIATGLSYADVYAELNLLAQDERPRQGRKRSNARTGVHSRTAGRFLEAQGFTWVSCMGIGTGCTTHLRTDELPAGRLVTRLSRHFCAVVDGVIHDTFDTTRDGTRCVYGYWAGP